MRPEIGNRKAKNSKMKTIMQFIPYESLTLETNLTTHEIFNRLKENIGNEKPFNFDIWGDKKYKYFDGTIDGASFEILRNIRGRNSFRGIIFGVVVDGTETREIILKIRMHIAVYIFSGFWLSFAGIAALSMFSHEIYSKRFSPSDLLIYGMFAFGYCLTLFGFKYDSLSSIRKMKEIFEANSHGR
jgi:hypothetical protein